MFKQKSKTPITFQRVFLLALPVVLLVSIAAAMARSGQPVSAATSNTVNFQARLLTAAGNVVPDGYYNVEFKVYKAATLDSGETTVQGVCTTNPGAVADEDCLWTETRIGADKVRVANGYLTVNLGSVTAFPNTMPWDQQLWLTMNIGGTGSPTWDGEMNPRLKLTATPYAFSSGKLVSADGTGSATVANGDVGTICVQNSLNCGFVQLQGTVPASPQTGSFNISGVGKAFGLQSNIIDSNGGALYLKPHGGIVLPGSPTTLGLTGGSTNDGPGWDNGFSATKVTMDNVNGTTLSMSIDYTGGTVGKHVQFGLYTNDVDNLPGLKLAESSIVNIVPNGRTTATITEVSLSPNTVYWLAVNTDDTTAIRKKNSGSSTNSCYVYRSFGSMPNDYSPEGCFTTDDRYNLSLTYLPLAGGSQAALVLGSNGEALFQNTTNSTAAFRIQNASAANTIFNADTTNARVAINQMSAAYTLDVNGDINITNGNSFRINGTQVCTSAGCVSSATSAIQNQTSQQTSANFWIDGTGKAAILQAATFDAATAASALDIGTTNANAINLNKNVTVASGKSLTIAGGVTGTRPASPAEGTLYYDSTAKQLLVYANSKWQADRSSSTKIVSMGAPAGCTGTVPAASLNSDAADYVVSSCTSAQTTINTAITALGSAGGTVYLTEGTYIIDGSINITSNVKLVGSGAGTVLKMKNATTSTTRMVSASTVNRIAIENIRFDGNVANNGSASSQAAIYLNAVGSGSGASAVPGAQIHHVWVENFKGQGIVFNGGANTSIADSYFAQTELAAIDVLTAASNITVTNNIFQSAAINLFSTSQYWTITGNVFNEDTMRLIAVSGAGTTPGYHAITGNTLSSSGIEALYIDTLRNTISNNTISALNDNAIDVEVNGDDITIKGNKIHMSGTVVADGVNVKGSGVSIIANHITTTSTGNGVGIYVASAAVKTYLADNTFSNMGTNGVINDGKETVYANQQSNKDIVITSTGGLGLHTTNVDTSMTLQGGLKSVALSSPAAPTVVKVGGGTGAASYTYAVSAYDGLGETLVSTGTAIGSEPATLNGTTFNRISWYRVSGAISYKIYRTATSGSTHSVGLIGTVSASNDLTQFDDTGITQSGTLPTQNTTGGAYFAGGITATKGFNMTYNAGSVFTIQDNNSTFVTIDPQNNKFFIGSDDTGCSGRFCVYQNIATTGGSTYTNSYNYIRGNASVTSNSTFIGQDIKIEDDSTVAAGATNRAIRIDFTASSNANSTYNGLYIKNVASVSTASYGGNAILIDNGSTTTFRASNTGAVLVQNTVNSATLFEVKNAAGKALLTVDSTNGMVHFGDTATTGVGSTANLSFGDTGCTNTRGCLWIGENGTTDSDILQMHGDTGIRLSTTINELQRIALEENGTFNISDNFASQTKGYRFRTDGSGLDLQSTGSGVTGELWLSGYSTANYTGTQVNFFRMMSYNRVVQVGDAADTATPTILALAKKTDSGSDPTGYEGGMYYNTQLSSMRCYQNGVWTDCMGVPKPNTRRTAYYGGTGYSSAAMSAGTNGTLAFPTSFAGYGDSINLIGAGAATSTFVVTTAGVPSQVRVPTSAVANAVAGVWGGSMLNGAASPSMQAYANISRITAYRMFIGMSDVSTIADQLAVDNPLFDYAGFRALPANANWQCVNDNASGAPTVTSTSIAVAASTGHRFEVIIDSGTRIIYKINNNVVCTHTTTTKFPGASSNAAMRMLVLGSTTNTTALNVQVAWVYHESDY